VVAARSAGVSRREPVEGPLIVCGKAGSANAADSAANRRARSDGLKRVSVDELPDANDGRE
jgi:hypothetical protein